MTRYLLSVLKLLNSYLRITLSPKIMVQFCSLIIYFGIKTVPCLLLQQMTRIDVDLNLKNWANVFKF